MLKNVNSNIFSHSQSLLIIFDLLVHIFITFARFEQFKHFS